MAKPILVGCDPGATDRAAVSFGAAAARFTGAPLIVGFVSADDAEAAAGADALRQELARDGVRAQCEPIHADSAPAGLHRAAERLDAGLLVVGSTTHGKRHRITRGTTAERLLHGAPCPVAVVPAGWEAGRGLRSVGVGFTDTPEGREALDSGLALARSAGATIRVLVAVEEREYGRASKGRPGGERSSYDAVGAEADAIRDGVVAEAARLEPGLEVEVDVSSQDATAFLLAASENLDLLVCGSRGYGPMRAVLLGGVSGRVTAAAACPVIVLARGVGAGMRDIVDDRAGSAA